VGSIPSQCTTFSPRPRHTRAGRFFLGTFWVQWGVGKVLNQLNIPLERSHYDLVIVGAGMLGLSLAFWLRTLAPQHSVLIVEEGGIPRERGATQNRSGIFAPPNWDEQTQFVWDTLQNIARVTQIQRPYDPVFQPCGAVHLTRAGNPIPLSPPVQHNLERLLDLRHYAGATWQPQAGYGSPSSVALHFGFGAVARGADLMLNARAVAGTANTLSLERLDIDNTMRVHVGRRDTLSYDRLVLAAGAWSGDWLACNLHIPSTIPLRYVQHLRLDEKIPLERIGNEVNLPVILVDGFRLRPHFGGVLLELPDLPANLAPNIQQIPTGGTLEGVGVGLCAAALEGILDHLEDMPMLGSEHLFLGKTSLDLMGSWQVAQDLPSWRKVHDTLYTLLGGKQTLERGLAVARDLAVALL
jgi:hypothetical protein